MKREPVSSAVMLYPEFGLNKRISRKAFLKKIFGIILGLGIIDFFGSFFKGELQAEDKIFPLREAMFYKKLDNLAVECQVCFRKCLLKDGMRGFCRNKENRKGTLYSLVWSRPSAVQIDPIEKEPVYHFYPGTDILCIATLGCSFRCKFCHNWHISHSVADEKEITETSPEEIVKIAKKQKVVGISTTYTEPTVFYEYMLDIYKLAKKEGLKNIMHTCGSIKQEPLKELLKY